MIADGDVKDFTSLSPFQYFIHAIFRRPGTFVRFTVWIAPLPVFSS